MSYEKYMKRCLELGEIALQEGNPPVGSLIVLEDQIIAEARETARTTGDITNHAEILAIKGAVKNGYKEKLSQAVLYTTHEPCVMCSYPIRQYRIPRIVFGLTVDYIGGFTSKMDVLKTIEVPHWGSPPKVIAGICWEECEDLNRRFKEKHNT